MIQCRARMHNGQPVMFERTVSTLMRSPRGDYWLDEFVGVGFHVVSEVPFGDTGFSPGKLEDRVRFALERSGVDAATAERWEDRSDASIAPGRWVPLFPSTLKEEPPDSVWKSRRPPIKITYVDKIELGEAETEEASKWIDAVADSATIPAGVDWHRAAQTIRKMLYARQPYYPLPRLTKPKDTSLSAEMIWAGSAALKDMVDEEAVLERGELWFRDATKVVTAIWTRMEKVRSND